MSDELHGGERGMSPKLWSELVEAGNRDRMRRELAELHPADIAALMEQLPGEEQEQILTLLEAGEVPQVIAELDEQIQKRLLNSLPSDEAAAIIGELASDDAADFLGLLDDERLRDILDHLPHKDQLDLVELLTYDEESAGGIMAKEAIIAQRFLKVSDVIRNLRRLAKEIDDIYNIYVVDRNRHLVGVVSLKDLVVAEPETTIDGIMDADFVAVNVNLDREQVAEIFKHYDLASAPVVDDEGRFVGRITHDDIMDVLEEEVHEDIAHLTGQAEFDPGERSLLRNIRHRLPWLFLALIGELAAATVLSHFEPTLVQITALAFFLPLIAAMGGNAGIQTSSLTVRGLATGEIHSNKIRIRLLREVAIAVLTGLACSSVIFLVAWFWQGNFDLAIVVSTALVAVIICASMVGILVPLGLKRFGFDPAVATGPFITTTNDIFGLMIYMSIATYILFLK